MIFKLKKNLRKEFREPLGKIVKGKEDFKRELKKLIPHRDLSEAGLKYEKLICVGDFSSFIVREIGFTPDISIIDGKIKRKKVEEKILRKIQAPLELRASNPPGTITREAWETVKLSFCYTMPVKIFIQGEEDLLFLPACFFAPSGSAIVYGLKDKGGIIVSVEKETKKKMRGYLSNIQKWDEVIAGGTFDRFHAGHKYFLLTALENGKKSLIGITSEEYLEEWKKNNGDVSSIQKRVKKLKEFLSKFDFNYELFKINDPFGPSLKRGEAIIVSKETQKRVKEINKERKKKEIKELKIIKVRTVMAENGKEISSSQIRNGEIDENGRITSKL